MASIEMFFILSSVMFDSLAPNAQKENLGIIVSYKVKIRLILGFGTRFEIMVCYYNNRAAHNAPQIWRMKMLTSTMIDDG